MARVDDINRNRPRPGESGSIFTVLLGAVALTAVIGVTAFQTLSGPLMTAVRVKNKTLAETELQATARIVLVDAANRAGAGDCDGDAFVEPTAWRVGAGPTNAGLLPLTIGAPATDPWGTSYGYCVWDVGPTTDDAACGGPGALRLDGADDPSAGNADTQTVLAIVSAGPDRQFQTSCADYVDATTSVLTKGGDDIVLKYSYAEARSIADGLWTLKSGDPDTATIAKDVEVGSNLSIDSATGQLWAGGGVELGDESLVTVCDGTNVGLMRYNTVSQTVEVCDGSSWSAVSAADGAGVTNGLVGWWKLDDGAGATAADSSGNGLDATLSGGPAWTTSGYLDGALTFDGTDDYAEVADNALLDVTRVTVSAWAYKTVANDPGWGAFISRQYSTAGENLFWMGYEGASASDLYNCFIRTPSGFVQAVGTASTGDVNQWVHIACVYDGADVILYKNGVVIGSAAQTGDIDADSTRLVIGADNEDATFTNITDFAQARLDDVRMYNRALSTSELGTMVGGTIDALTDAYAGYATTSNMILGREQAAALTSGAQYNVFIGQNAGATSANSTAATDNNVAVGYSSLAALSSGSANIAIGANALASNTTVSGNVAIGMDSLRLNTGGALNLAIGANALESATSNNFNVALGGNALANVASVNASNAVAIGHNALANNTAHYMTAVGYQALMENRARLNNTAVGYEAMRYADSTTTIGTGGNTAVGYRALRGSTTAANNTGRQNTAVGYEALRDFTSGESNVAVGSGVLAINTTGSYNVVLGHLASGSNTVGHGNVSIGFRALSSNGTRQESTAVGHYAMRSACDAAGGAITYNTAVGAYALQGSGTAANNTGTGNTALGHSVFQNMTSGSNNTAIGYNAGNAITTGSSNILIGYNTATPAATTSSHLNIGNTIYGDLANDFVGIGTASPTYGLHLVSEAVENKILMEFAGDTAGMDPEFSLARSQGTLAANTAVASGDNLGSFWPSGYDGAGFSIASVMEFEVDGTPVSGGDVTDMPGRISFMTTPDGTASWNSPRMTIKASGAIGIGTTLPLTELHLRASEETGLAIDSYADNGAHNSYLELKKSRGTAAAPTVVLSGDILGELLVYGYNGSVFNHATHIETVVDGAVTGGGAADMPARMEFNVQADGAGAWMGDGDSPAEMVIMSSGAIGIGTESPDEGKLEVKGGSVCVDTNSDNTASSCIANESDARLKKNVRDLEYSLDTLMKLRPVSFDWKHDDPEVLKHYPLVSRFASQPHGIGFLAQDVQKLIPEAIEAETVGDAEVQYLQLDYAKLVPVVVDALQEQQERFAELNEGIGRSETELDGGDEHASGSGVPPDSDCASDAERGRSIVDVSSGRFYVCNGAARGWDYVTLVD